MKLTLSKLTVAVTLTGAFLGGAAIAAQHKEGIDGEKRTPRAERMFEKMDADSDGKVTPEEVQAFAAARFAKRDIDGDGVVSREDRKTFHTNRRTERRTKRFEKIDADGDGMISLDEFTAFKPEGRRGGRRGERGDRAERGHHGERGHRMHGHRGHRMHGEHHGSRGMRGHGRRHAPLTIQEAEARAMQRFERIDSDEKGHITLNDVKAFHADKRGRHGRK